MKKLLLSCALALATLSLWAAQGDYDYLVMQSRDGSTQTFQALGLAMNFSGSSLTVTSGGVTETYQTANLDKMYFSDGSTTAIGKLLSAAGTLCEVYSADGRLLRTMQASSLASLPRGLYIIKNNNQTRKITVR